MIDPLTQVVGLLQPSAVVLQAGRWRGGAWAVRRG